MTNKQLHLMKSLSQQREERLSYVFWTFEGIEESDIEELQDLGYVFVSIGEGFVGGLRSLSLTAAGHDFIKDFCDSCECMPCDCDWGQQ